MDNRENDGVWHNVKLFFHGLGEIDHATSSKNLIPEIKRLARKAFGRKEPESAEPIQSLTDDGPAQEDV